MVGDHYNDKFKKQWPSVYPDPLQWNPPTRQEFEALKKQVEEMMELLKRAKEYDEQNGEPDCEIEEKWAKLREIAKVVGLDLDELGISPKK